MYGRGGARFDAPQRRPLDDPIMLRALATTAHQLSLIIDCGVSDAADCVVFASRSPAGEWLGCRSTIYLASRSTAMMELNFMTTCCLSCRLTNRRTTPRVLHAIKFSLHFRCVAVDKITCPITETYTVSGKKETKMFSVISPTKLGQLS